MHWIDWLIVFGPLVIVCVIGIKTQKYVKSVSDFLSAGRVAGRYVIAVAEGEAIMGLVTLISMFEVYYNSGMAYQFWGSIGTPIAIIFYLTGFCIYRYRETRVMTMGQLLEIRYNRTFRIYAGILQSISGILGFAIFPAIGARFLVYFCGMPLGIQFAGIIFPTFLFVTILIVALEVFVTMLGGQITVMVTDCVQGILSYPMYAVVAVFLLCNISWFTEIAPTLLDRDPGLSMIDPFDIEKLRTFNLFYVAVALFGGIINRMAYSGGRQGYYSAAFTAHEQKMGAVLGAWRGGFQGMMFILLALVGITMLNIDSDYLHKVMGDKIDIQKVRKLESNAVEVRKELTRKALKDAASGDEFEPIRKEIHGYLDTGKISPELQAKIDAIKADEELKKEEKQNRKIELGLLDPDKEVQEDKPSRERPNREEMVSVTRYALKTQGNDGIAKAQRFATYFHQLRVPMALRHMLPAGIMGVFCALCIFLMISTGTTQLHSWSGIIVQDIILPIRGKPFTPRQQLRLLRIFIAIIGLFAIFFSYYFGQVDYIMMFLQIIGAIWLGGAGICTLGALYWKRGTTAGAFTSLIIGSTLAVSTIVLQKTWGPVIYPWLDSINMVPTVAAWLENASAPLEPYIKWRMNPDVFPINSMEMFFMTMLLTISSYIIISLLTCRKPFNMDRMLHRGKYQRKDEAATVVKERLTFRNGFKKMVGIDSHYSKGDKVLAWSVYIWSMGWGFGYFITVVVWNKFFYRWPKQWWVNVGFYRLIAISVFIGTVTSIWFTVGGVWDLRRLFKRLAKRERSLLDDGRVIDNVSADDVELVEKVDNITIEDAHIEEEILKKELEDESRHGEKKHNENE